MPPPMAPAFNVGPVDPRDDARWEAILAHFPAATFFHSSAWLRVLRASYSLQDACLCARAADGTPAALAPLVEINSWLTGRRGVSLPFTDECQPLATSAAAKHAIVDGIAREARARKWKYWELRGGGDELAAPPATSYYGHQLPLLADPSRLFSRCDSATRRAVRKAEQSGLTLSFAHDLEATRAFHALLGQTRKRHGMPVQPFGFFENIQRHVLAPRHGCIVLARLNDTPVAGAVFFHFRRAALFKFGASDHAFQHLRPNNLVMWRAIEWHARAGFASLDFGRTSLGDEGLRRFKLGWGAVERRLDYFRFNCRHAAFVKTHDRSSGWHTGLIKLLPVAFARLLGAAAYRHVA